MDSILKKGLFLVTFSGALAAFPMTARASDTDAEEILSGVGIEAVLNECYSSNKNIEIEEYLVPTNKGEYLDMAFADVETFLYIRSEPTKESEWVGKLYPDYAAKIIGPVGEWTKIESGSVTGYVCSEYITVGNKAEAKAQEIIEEEKTENVDDEDIFLYAESKQEEEERLAREALEAEKRAEEEAKNKETKGQAIVDYACQFIGNPFVWCGTSLTYVADCSGFVQSVFAHFGISLPRTSGEMRSSGTEVSYDEAIAGDIICYDGHVGIYMGDGQIVNAINSDRGIGVLSATYSGIITVRRLI